MNQLSYREEKSLTKTLLWAAVILTVCLFFVRFILNTSFTQPWHLTTSGYEEESLYAVWKYIYKPNEVYSDFHNIPFAASYFNWLFYSTYGEFTKTCIVIFRLSDEWIPQIGRVLTLLGCIVGFIYSVLVLQLLNVKAGKINLALSAYIFFSPLIGFWGFTVRPDLWAVVFEVIAFYYFLRFENKSPLGGALIFSLICYLAWSFKQSHIELLSGVCLYLLFSKRFKELFVIVAVSTISYALTFYVFRGTDYLYMILISQAKMPMYAWLALRLCISAIVKSPLTLLSVPVLLTYVLVKNAGLGGILAYKKIKPLLFIFTTYLLISLLLSMKAGASDNYFIGLSVFSAFLLIVLVDYFGMQDRIVRFVLNTSSCIAILGVVIVSLGYQGRVNLDDLRAQNGQIKQCILRLKGPVFVNSGYGSLPWMNSSGPSFILAATYFYKDAYGDFFERDGIEGLIKQKYFQSILIPSGNLQLDENLLKLAESGYEIQNIDDCYGLRVYVKGK